MLPSSGHVKVLGSLTYLDWQRFRNWVQVCHWVNEEGSLWCLGQCLYSSLFSPCFPFVSKPLASHISCRVVPEVLTGTTFSCGLELGSAALHTAVPLTPSP